MLEKVEQVDDGRLLNQVLMQMEQNDFENVLERMALIRY